VAETALTERAEATGVETIVWTPRRGDFNEDLRALGPAALRIQLVPQDVARFMLLMSAETGWAAAVRVSPWPVGRGR
jgi:hypothetical protein